MGFLTSERLLWGALVVALLAGVVSVVTNGLGTDTAAIGVVVLIIGVCIGVRRGEKTGERSGV